MDEQIHLSNAHMVEKVKDVSRTYYINLIDKKKLKVCVIPITSIQ